MAAIMQATARPAAISNVVSFQPRLCEAHRALLAAWVKAGRRMGLHDAEIIHRTPEGAVDFAGMAVIWVRENPDPAYLVRFEGVGWAVVDFPPRCCAGPLCELCAGTPVHPPGAERTLRTMMRPVLDDPCGGWMQEMPNAPVKTAAWLALAACVVVIGVALEISVQHGAAPLRPKLQFSSTGAPAALVLRRAIRPPGPPAAPPVAGASRPATIAPSLGSALDAALAKLAPAQVAFTAPPRMALGRTQEIRAVLSLNLSGDALKALLPAAGRIEVDPLKVSDTMTASLYGEGFKIAPQSTETQIVSRANTTEWHWFVTPVATGSLTLFS